MEAIMRRLSILAAMFAAAAALPGAANAVTCYTVLDRSDTTIYQDSDPPFDMSDRGAAVRAAMRGRNEFLTISEVDRCLTITAPPGNTAYRAASVDEIVSGMRAFATGGSGASSAAGGRGSARATPAASSTGSSSTSARKY
jgi:hypothetical protein